MPIATSHPGVYVQEISSGVRTIVAAPTSVTAFVGRALRGSTDALVRCSSWTDFERRCGGLWADSELGHAVQQYFLNGGSTAIISRVDDDATAAEIDLAGPSGPLTLTASSPGTWGDDLRVEVDHGTPGTVTATADGAFHLTVRLVDPAVLATTGDVVRATLDVEVHAHLSVDPDAPRAVTPTLAQRSRLVRATAVGSDRPDATGGAVAPTTAGADGTEANAGDADYEDAIDRLDEADTVNLLCIPPPDRTHETSLATWTHAVAWAADHRALVLVDPPSSWGDAEAAAALADGYDALRSPNSSFWYPRLLAGDPLQAGMTRPMAPGGAIAGVIARTDATRGVWTAPAGQDATVRGVAGVERAVDQDASGLVNPRGVNAIRELPVVGPVVWGARTGVGADTMASEWKYLPVRRTALHIETSLERGLRWAVFEPNDVPLWREISLAVTSFMQDLFRRGAFLGSSPRDAYLVKCDAETTTPADVEAGVVNLLVGFAPLRPAEFVILSFTQLAGQSGS